MTALVVELGQVELKLMEVLEATKIVVELGAAELMVLWRRSYGVRSGGGQHDGARGGGWGSGVRGGDRSEERQSLW